MRTAGSLTGRIDALQRKQYVHLRQHTLADREPSARKRALALAVGALVAYLLVVVAVMLAAPDLLVSVLIGGIGEALGVAVGMGVGADAQSEPSPQYRLTGGSFCILPAFRPREWAAQYLSLRRVS